MASRDYTRLLESIVKAGRHNNKMFDFANITLRMLNSPLRSKRMIGESLAKGRGLAVYALNEARTSRWLEKVELVREGAGWGLRAIMNGKEYRYTKEGMTAQELLDKVNQIWDEKGPGAVGQFLRKECMCYLGSKDDSIEGRVRAGYNGR